MDTIFTWPERLPTSLDGLYEEVAARLGGAATYSLDGSHEGVLSGGADGGSRSAVVVIDAAILAGNGDPTEALEVLRTMRGMPGVDLVAIVGDGYLGTDNEELDATMGAAAAIAVVRSLAVRRGWGSHANAICVPDAMFGRESAQRGPLRQGVERRDVSDAVSFLLGDDGCYLNGQVLFVDGGRQLFSSLSA